MSDLGPNRARDNCSVNIIILITHLKNVRLCHILVDLAVLVAKPDIPESGHTFVYYYFTILARVRQNVTPLCAPAGTRLMK